MTAETAASLVAHSMLVAFYVLLPVALGCFAIAIVVSAVQAALQLQDSTVGFVPRLLVGGAMLLLFGPWMLSVAASFARETWRMVAGIGG
jgi:flagellar biosynthetic protein FliQ